MLQIHNSLTRRKETFVPIEPGEVRMYVCGMTVYDYCHLGHARALVIFDTVVRHLRRLGYAVRYVRNITDVDDKIIRRAAETGEAPGALTARFTAAMHEDADALGCLRPDLEPRATAHMDTIIAMIARLIEAGYAYRADNGDVYYAVARFPEYGKLSGERLEDLRAGARIEPGEGKRDPADFALWKTAQPGEPSWPSPWGEGRPGWHIECSAMSTEALGPHFDIHGGGLDLKFPHHENEIAQSEAACGGTFVNYWMHNGHVRIDDEKMSKSLGNFFTVRDILTEHPPEAVRYFLLTSHYRSPLNYTMDSLGSAVAALERLYLALRDVPEAEPLDSQDWRARFDAAMNEDFNTPEALAVLFELARVVNRAREAGDRTAAGLAALLRELGADLGLLQEDPEAFLKRGFAGGPSDAEVERLIAERAAARASRNFARADAIRDDLQAQGIVIEDAPEGTTWRRSR